MKIKSPLTGIIKRQTFVIVSCLVIVVLSTILVSNAVYSKTISQTETKENIVQTASFDVSFTNGNAITSSKVYVSSDEEGMKTAGKTFSVGSDTSMPISYVILLGRSSSASSSTHVDHQYIKYSLDGAKPRTLSTTEIFSGSSVANYEYKIGTGTFSSAYETNRHTLQVWLDANTPESGFYNKTIDLEIRIEAVPLDPATGHGVQFEYTGEEQTYTIPYSGTYTITAAGAQGSVGNLYNLTDVAAYKGAAGATIHGDFYLEQGDILHIIVGEKGNDTPRSTDKNDGAGGVGGGGSFIFKEIPKIVDSRYQISKSFNGTTKYLDTLLIAAGGSGTGDIGYNSSKYLSYPGVGVTFYSPASNPFQATSGVDGITKYSSGDLIGTSYDGRPPSVCEGTFGGGRCSDDSQGSGGGWYVTNNTAFSWSQGSNTIGTNGTNSGNGYVNIKFKS